MPGEQGFSACFSSFARSWSNMAPTDAKASCLYPNGQRAIRDAANRGFDNAIMLDGDGNIAEFATSNLWIVKNGVVSTPVDNGTFLNGITRRRVRCSADGVEVQERSLTRADVESADECFLGQLRQGGARQPRRGPRAGIRPAGAPRPQALHGLRGKHAQALTPIRRGRRPLGGFMSNRRDFLRTGAALAGAAGALGLFPAAIRRALAIEPDRRSGTLRDVAHRGPHAGEPLVRPLFRRPGRRARLRRPLPHSGSRQPRTRTPQRLVAVQRQH